MDDSAVAAQPASRVRDLAVYCLERDTLVHSIRTALVVGTLLALINHAADLLAGQLSARWLIPMLLSYVVPFGVATYGQVHGKRQRDRLPSASERRQAVPPPTSR